jgi:preprotein translocase subunit YajC
MFKYLVENIPLWVPFVMFLGLTLWSLIFIFFKIKKSIKFNKEIKIFRENLKKDDKAFVYVGEFSSLNGTIEKINEDNTVDLILKNVSKNFLYHKES